MPRRSPLRPALVALSLGLVACDSSAGPSETGLRGLVTIGPILPVCPPDQPCEQSIQASFLVYHGSKRVSQFASDTRGLYSVQLPAGQYLIVPVEGGVIPFPETQTVTVRVAPTSGPTVVDLHFSTGLR